MTFEKVVVEWMLLNATKYNAIKSVVIKITKQMMHKNCNNEDTLKQRMQKLRISTTMMMN